MGGTEVSQKQGQPSPHHLQLSCRTHLVAGGGGGGGGCLAPVSWPQTRRRPPPPCSGASEGSVQQPPLELEPGEYRVLLCVDTGEAKG